MIEEYIRSLILRFFNYLYSIFNIRLDANEKETIERGRSKADYITRYFL
jgi:hypothetical protein